MLLDPADANAIQEVNLAYENVKEVDGLDVSKDGSEAWEAAIKRLVSSQLTCRITLSYSIVQKWCKKISQFSVFVLAIFY